MPSILKKETWVSSWRYLTDFDKEKTIGEKFGIVAGLLVLNLLYTFIIISVLQAICSETTLQKYIYWGWLTKSNDVQDKMYKVMQSNWGISVFFAVVLSPLWEELVFRTYWFWKKLRKRDKEAFYNKAFTAEHGKMPIWDFVFFSSIIFGILHGGPINIPIQGVGGLFLAYCFLLCGRSYWSAVLLHAGFNGALLIVSYIGSKGAIVALTLPHWLYIFVS